MPLRVGVRVKQNWHRARNASSIATLEECGLHPRTIVLHFRGCTPESIAEPLSHVASLQQLASLRSVRSLTRCVEVTATLLPGRQLTIAAVNAVTDELVEVADVSGFRLEGWDVLLPDPRGPAVETAPRS